MMLENNLKGNTQRRFNFDLDRCIGCGACVNACLPGLISMVDIGDRRIIEFAIGRCIYFDCTRCVEVCQEKAISITEGFEFPSERKDELKISYELLLAKCERCGMPFTTRRIIDKVAAQLPKETGIEPAALDWLKICPNCRILREGQRQLKCYYQSRE